MNRYPFFLCLTASLLLTAAAHAGSLTLTTYYPSPSGNYDKLTADNVGIGSISPSANLDVIGFTQIHDSGVAPNNVYGGMLRLTGAAASGQYINIIRAGSYPWSIGTVYNSNTFAIGAGLATDSSFTNPFFVLDTNGNVGIGAPLPQGKLHIIGQGTGYATVGNAGCGGNYTGLALNGQAMASCTNYNLLSNPTTPDLFLNRPTTYNIHFREQNGADQMTIATGGNVGIAEAAPASALAVKGVGHFYPVGTPPNNNYNASLRVTQPQASGQYINLVRAGSYPWSIGTVYNSNTFAIGTGVATDSSFTNPFFVLDTGGNVGIGVAAPGKKLDVSGVIRGSNEIISSALAGLANIRMIGNDYGAMWRNDGTNFYLLFTAAGDQYGTWSTLRPFYVTVATGDVHIGTSLAIAGTNAAGYSLVATGPVQASGFFYPSDKRLKKNIHPIVNALDKVKNLEGVGFTWKKTGKKDMGVIAQNVEKVLPDLVATDKDGMKSVEYGNLTAVLIEAVKEQQKQIEDLKKQVAKLEKGSR